MEPETLCLKGLRGGWRDSTRLRGTVVEKRELDKRFRTVKGRRRVGKRREQ